MAGKETTLPSIFLRKSAGDVTDKKLLKVKKANYASAFKNAPGSSDSQEFSFFGKPSSIFDMFGKSLFLDYGIVDSEGDVVIPKQEALVVAGKGTDMRFGIEFAARAFNDLQFQFTSDRAPVNHANKLRKSPYARFGLSRAYVSLDTEHSKFLEDVYEGFMLPYLRTGNRDRNIKSYDNFLKFFLEDFFPNVMIPEGLMLSRSNFARSTKCTPLISGLVFEISNTSHNNDKAKYEQFLSNSAYNVVKDGSAVFGFMVDKNAPWRFVANLNSPKMLNYIQGKKRLKDQDAPTRFKSDGVTPLESGDVFSYYYKKAYKNDITVIKNTILNIYNAHVGRRSYVTTPVPNFCSPNADGTHGSPVIVPRRDFRFQESFENLSDQYPDDYWLFEYFKIRLLELGVILNDERLLKQKSKISKINKYVGYDEAQLYINEYVKGFGNSLTSGGYRAIPTYGFNIAKKPGLVAQAETIELEEG